MTEEDRQLIELERGLWPEKQPPLRFLTQADWTYLLALKMD